MAFPVHLPKFNSYSIAVMGNYERGLLQQQREALEKLKGWFAEDNRDPGIALVSMPTGSGKTGVLCCLPYTLGSIGLEAPRDAGNFPIGNPRYRFDNPVLVIAPSLEIANQLEGQILVVPDKLQRPFLVKRGIIPENMIKHVLPKGLKISETSQLRSADFLRDKDVVIANAQKFSGNGAWEDDLPSDLFQLVIVDEAHHFPAQTWYRIIDKFRQHALVVFFTATPYRGNGEKVLPKPFAYELSLKVARERRIIRDVPEPIVVCAEPLDAENQDVEIFQLVLEKVNEVQERKNRDTPLPNDIPHMAIAITRDKSQADLAVEVWNNQWGEDTAFAYHSDLSPYDRQQKMERIRCNQVKLVVVVAMLREGFDHPPISIAVILTKIVSPVKFVQFIGRAQRIVRGYNDQESDAVRADIITHEWYQQEENYSNFQNEHFIA